MSRSPLKADFDRATAQVLTKPGKPFTPYWLPEQGVDRDLPEHVRTMDQKVLVNILNYLHFSDRSLLVHVRENGNHIGHLLPVFPEPCLDGEVACRWPEPIFLDDIEEMIRNLIIDDGKSMIIVPVTVTTKNKKTFASRLPDISYVISRRQEKRYPCSEITVEIRTKGQILRGKLRDFSSMAFRVSPVAGDMVTKSFLNTGDSVNLQLMGEKNVYFGGKCSCLRVEQESGKCNVIFRPSVSPMPVFEKRRVRNPRLELNPHPSLHFYHPLIRKYLQMEIEEIGTSGFSVHEDSHNCLLLPGLLIPKLSVQYMGYAVMNCAAQVVYRNDGGKGVIRCGLAILDTEVKDYTRLSQLVENALDPCARISTQIDPDALWDLFFTTGFIYPKKYRNIYGNKEDLKKNFREIYENGSEIANHFVHQKNGRIYGHISILRAYERAWMIHHHAASNAATNRSGFLVLKQAMHFLNDMHRLPSLNMDYAMCYFRPENRFPNLVFGGFANTLKNRLGCSMDTFAYLVVPRDSLQAGLPEGWKLEGCRDSDLRTVKKFYRTHSGGLLLEALGLENGHRRGESLEKVYSRLGLLRKTKLFSLKYEGDLMAFLISNQSDKGVNFSQLLNSISILVIPGEKLPWGILFQAISRLSKAYDLDLIPVLLYPFEYVEKNKIPYEKTYQLWILSVLYGNEFMEHMQKRFRIS